MGKPWCGSERDLGQHSCVKWFLVDLVGYICSLFVCICFHSANLVSRQGSALTLPLCNKGFLVLYKTMLSTFNFKGYSSWDSWEFFIEHSIGAKWQQLHCVHRYHIQWQCRGLEIMFKLRWTTKFHYLRFLNLNLNLGQRHTQFHEKTASTLVCFILLVFIWEYFGVCNFVLTWFSFFSCFFLYITHVCFPTYIHVVCIRNFKWY